MNTDLPGDVGRLTDAQVVAATIWGEARNSGLDGMVAVGAVIANRVHSNARLYGTGWRGVCLRPYQFSCWRENGGKANFDAMARIVGLLGSGELVPGAPWRQALAIAVGLIEAGRARHYMTAALYASRPPRWALRNGGEKIRASGASGGHLFFTGVDG